MEHGEVFTRRWVVDLILDLLGYTADKDLCGVKLVEPACGTGAFLAAVASRISASCRAHKCPIGDTHAAVRALDLLGRNVEQSRAVVEKQLLDEGWQADPDTLGRVAGVEEELRQERRDGIEVLAAPYRAGSHGCLDRGLLILELFGTPVRRYGVLEVLAGDRQDPFPP
ncbi:hypothetical protein [Streptomyces chartreusis]